MVHCRKLTSMSNWTHRRMISGGSARSGLPAPRRRLAMPSRALIPSSNANKLPVMAAQTYHADMHQASLQRLWRQLDNLAPGSRTARSFIGTKPSHSHTISFTTAIFRMGVPMPSAQPFQAFSASCNIVNSGESRVGAASLSQKLVARRRPLYETLAGITGGSLPLAGGSEYCVAQ